MQGVVNAFRQQGFCIKLRKIRYKSILILIDMNSVLLMDVDILILLWLSKCLENTI